MREDLTGVLGVPARARVKRGALLFLWHGLARVGGKRAEAWSLGVALRGWRGNSG